MKYCIMNMHSSAIGQAHRGRRGKIIDIMNNINIHDVYGQNVHLAAACKTPVTAVSDKSKTIQEDEKTVYFSIRVTKKLSMALIGRHN